MWGMPYFDAFLATSLAGSRSLLPERFGGVGTGLTRLRRTVGPFFHHRLFAPRILPLGIWLHSADDARKHLRSHAWMDHSLPEGENWDPVRADLSTPRTF